MDILDEVKQTSRYSLREQQDTYRCHVVGLLSEILKELRKVNGPSAPTMSLNKFKEELDNHLVSKRGGWYEIDGEKIQGRDKAAKALEKYLGVENCGDISDLV